MCEAVEAVEKIKKKECVQTEYIKQSWDVNVESCLRREFSKRAFTTHFTSIM